MGGKVCRLGPNPFGRISVSLGERPSTRGPKWASRGGNVCWPLGDFADSDGGELCIAGSVTPDNPSGSGMANFRMVDVANDCERRRRAVEYGPLDDGGLGLGKKPLRLCVLSVVMSASLGVEVTWFSKPAFPAYDLTGSDRALSLDEGFKSWVYILDSSRRMPSGFWVIG